MQILAIYFVNLITRLYLSIIFTFKILDNGFDSFLCNINKIITKALKV